MRLHKFRLIALFSFIIAVTAFTSCSDDDHRHDLYKIEGYVDFEISAETRIDGSFRQGLVIDDSYITDADGRWIDPYRVERWDFIDHPEWSYLEIYKLTIIGNGQIDWFEIYVENELVYQYNVPIILYGETSFYVNDEYYYDAAYYIIDQLMRYGDVNIEVRGGTRYLGLREPIRFSFGNAVDFYVR